MSEQSPTKNVLLRGKHQPDTMTTSSQNSGRPKAAKNTLNINATKTWNELPSKIKSSRTLTSFKRKATEHLLAKQIEELTHSKSSPTHAGDMRHKIGFYVKGEHQVSDMSKFLDK